MTNELIRARILMAFADAPKTQPTLRELKESLGAASEQAIAYHIKRLQAVGFLARVPGVGLRTLPPGKEAAGLLLAVVKRESCIRRLAREHLGGYNRQATSALRRAADQLDANYLVTRLGIRRRVRGGGTELERKASGRDIIRALKQCGSIAEAALQVGIQPGALDQRVTRLVARAKRELETASA